MSIQFSTNSAALSGIRAQKEELIKQAENIQAQIKSLEQAESILLGSAVVTERPRLKKGAITDAVRELLPKMRGQFTMQDLKDELSQKGLEYDTIQLTSCLHKLRDEVRVAKKALGRKPSIYQNLASRR